MLYFHFPEEIVNNILSFCPGYMRADLSRKNISVKLQNGGNISIKLGLHEICTSEITFIEQNHRDNYVGYTCKSIKKNDGFIRYTWIKIMPTLTSS